MTVLSNTEGIIKIFIGTIVDCKKFSRLHPGEFFQVRQDDEPRDTIYIGRTVRAIVLGTQYNLQGDYFF